MSIEWAYGIVAFLDVLGFTNFVQSDANSSSPQHLTRILECLSEVRSSGSTDGLDLRSFSDTIVLSGDLSIINTANILTAVVNLQRAFIRRRVLIRGGVAFGKHFSDRDSIYSEALVRAYHLERDHARFPRVLVDPQLLDWFINDKQLEIELRDRVGPLLLRDRDEQVFINYLNQELIEAHASLLNEYEPRDLTASVLEKFQWLAMYNNYAAIEYDIKHTITGPLTNGFRPIAI